MTSERIARAMGVPESLLVSSYLCIGVVARVSMGFAFLVTFALSLVFMVRVLSPDLIDGFFVRVDALVQGFRHNARADLRDNPMYAAVQERARRAHAFVAEAIDGLERKARAKLSGLKDAAVVAFCWLRLAAGVINLLATVLITAALNEAKSRAPSFLRWRGVKGLRIRTPPNPVSSPDTTALVAWISAIVAYCTLVLTVNSVCSGITSLALCFPCFAALCGFALMEAERVYLWDSYAIDSSVSTAANPRRRASNAAGGVTEKDMREAWECLWFVVIMMHCFDAGFLYLVMGNRPYVLVSLAIYNIGGLRSTREPYLTPDDGEDADGAHVDVNKWQRAAMNVLVMDVAKVVATYLVLDFYLGALLFVSLCAKVAFLLDTAIYLSDEGVSGDDDNNQEGAGVAGDVAGEAVGSDEGNQEVADLAEDVAGDAESSDDGNREIADFAGDVVAGDAESSDEGNQEIADFAGDVVAGDAESSDDGNQEVADLVGDAVAGDAEGCDDVGAENSTDIAACDHEEEEGSATEEHTDVSDSEEQRRQEPDYSSSSSSSSSSSVGDWSLVGVDPMMPTDVNGGAKRRFGFFL